MKTPTIPGHRLISAEMSPAQMERMAFNLSAAFGPDFVEANKAFALAVYAETFAFARPTAPDTTPPAAAGEVEALRALSKKATPGPWFADSEKSDGSYGSGEDTHEGYDTAVILTEAETRHGKAGVLFESHNSTVGLIEEEYDDEYFRAWDGASEANAAFIVALVNAYRSGELLHRIHVLTPKAEGEASRGGAGVDPNLFAAAWKEYLKKPDARKDQIFAFESGWDAALVLRPEPAPGVGGAVEAPHPSDDDTERCFICGEAFQQGDLVLPDESEGTGHAACFGPDREAYTINGEPLKEGDPIPAGYPWTPYEKPRATLAALEARLGTGWHGIQADEDRIASWVLDRFGANSLNNPLERADRLLEEAIEMQQAVYAQAGTGRVFDGIEKAAKLVHHVYSKEPGHPQQEMGGVMTCALALGRRLGVRLDEAAQNELTRIEGLSKAHFDKRHQAKVDAGVAAQHERPATPPSPTSEGV